MSDKHNEQPEAETEFVFHTSGGEMDARGVFRDEIEEVPGGGWAADDFDADDFGFEFADDLQDKEFDDFSEEDWAEVEDTYGIQFHFEVDRPYVERWNTVFADVLAKSQSK